MAFRGSAPTFFALFTLLPRLAEVAVVVRQLDSDTAVLERVEPHTHVVLLPTVGSENLPHGKRNRDERAQLDSARFVDLVHQAKVCPQREGRGPELCAVFGAAEPLVADPEKVATDQRKAVEAAIKSVADDGMFVGMLPVGEFTFSGQAFKVEPGLSVRIEVSPRVRRQGPIAPVIVYPDGKPVDAAPESPQQ